MTAATDHNSGGVRFTFEEDLVTAIDVDSGVAACGPTKADALDELADALRLHDRDDSRFDTDAAEAASCGISVSILTLSNSWSTSLTF